MLCSLLYPSWGLSQGLTIVDAQKMLVVFIQGREDYIPIPSRSLDQKLHVGKYHITYFFSLLTLGVL